MLKENNGRSAAARRSKLRKVCIGICIITCCIILFVVRWKQPPPSEQQQQRKNTVTTIQHGDIVSLMNQKIPIPQRIRNAISKEELQQILQANVHLIELTIDFDELRHHLNTHQMENENDGTTDDEKEEDQQQQPSHHLPSYDGIYGTFCTLDWSLHKHDPSSYPMFRDLVDNSSQCTNNDY